MRGVKEMEYFALYEIGAGNAVSPRFWEKLKKYEILTFTRYVYERVHGKTVYDLNISVN
jgi:hypothetical protein